MGKKTFVIVLICGIFCIQGLFAQETFTMHLALVKDDKGLPFDKTVNMNNEEKFRIQLYSDRDCYVYIVVEQTSGSILTLMNERIKAGKVSTGNLSFDAKTQGQEKFYVITSSSEQKSLQKAIDAYNKEKNSKNTAMLKNALFAVKDPKGDNPGKPTAFAGSVRGDGDDEDTIQATEYSGSSVYTRTIVISH